MLSLAGSKRRDQRESELEVGGNLVLSSVSSPLALKVLFKGELRPLTPERPGLRHLRVARSQNAKTTRLRISRL